MIQFSRPCFSLRTLLLIALGIAAFMGFRARAWQKQNYIENLFDPGTGGFVFETSRGKWSSISKSNGLLTDTAEWLTGNYPKLIQVNCGPKSGLTAQEIDLVLSVPTLRRIYLGGEVTDSMIKRLCDLPQIDDLGFENSNLSDAQLSKLANQAQMETLHLSETAVTDRGLACLKNSTIELLALNTKQFTNVAIESLRDIPQLRTIAIQGLQGETTSISEMPNVEMINISLVAATFDGDTLPNLQSIHLIFLDALVASKNLLAIGKLTSVGRLSFTGCDLKLEHIDLMSAIPSLKSVELDNTSSSQNLGAILKTKRPDVTIMYR